MILYNIIIRTQVGEPHMPSLHVQSKLSYKDDKVPDGIRSRRITKSLNVDTFQGGLMCVYKQLFIVLNASRIAILLYTTSHTTIINEQGFSKRERILLL